MTVELYYCLVISTGANFLVRKFIVSQASFPTLEAGGQFFF